MRRKLLGILLPVLALLCIVFGLLPARVGSVLPMGCGDALAYGEAEPVLGPSAGEKVQQLLLPYKFDEEVLDRWVLTSIRIPINRVEITLTQDDDREIQVTLFPSCPRSQNAGRSLNFCIVTGNSSDTQGGKRAMDLLTAAIIRNDVDPIWESSNESVPAADLSLSRRWAEGTPSSYIGRIHRGILYRWERNRIRVGTWGAVPAMETTLNVVTDSGLVFYVLLILLLSVFATKGLKQRPVIRWVVMAASTIVGVALFPFLDVPLGLPGRFVALLQDGIVTIFLIGCGLILLTIHQLRGSSIRVVFALALTVLVGLVLRLLLSEPTAMTAWSYSRLYEPASLIYYGSVLPFLTSTMGITVKLTEIVHTSTLCLAVLTPWAVFLLAHRLTESEPIAIGAAAALALLPVHIRFSASDVAFVPSLLVSALALTVAHMAVFDSKRAWRIAAMTLLPFLSRYVVVFRSLDVLFAIVVVGMVFVLRPGDAPWSRRLMVGFLGFAPAVIRFVSTIMQGGSMRDVHAGLSLVTVVDGALQLFDPTRNTLLNPSIMPPLFLLGVAAGTWWLVRNRLRLALFLWGWLLMFFFAHAYVIPGQPAMIARYHLHLVVPFVLLLGAAVPMMRERLGRWALPLALAIGATSAFHIGFIRDVDFLEMHEYNFVREAAAKIPEGCWVIEPIGPGDTFGDSRFRRVTSQIASGVRQQGVNVLLAEPMNRGQFRLLPQERQEGDYALIERESLLEEPPDCLYFYRGLNCYKTDEENEEMWEGCIAPQVDGQPQVIMEDEFRLRAYDDNYEVTKKGADMFKPVLVRLRNMDGAD